ncbi:hypothetical protein B0H13DRAFT_2347539 [Mycena leptocephala]|nr:hypothetical protein B0H13DRAFT_2347539 [Mycena leptocephala]
MAEGLMTVLEREDVNSRTQWRSWGFGSEEMKPENTTQEYSSKEPKARVKGESQTTETPQTGAVRMGCNHKRNGDDVMQDKIQESTVPSPGAHRTVLNRDATERNMIITVAEKQDNLRWEE